MEDGEDNVKEVFMKESFPDGVKIVQGHLSDHMLRCFPYNIDYNTASFIYF